MQKIIELLLQAADNHGADSGEQDHAVGDLQDMLRLAWSIMGTSQKLLFLRKSGINDVIEAGSRGEFTADSLISEINQELVAMETAVAAAGYTMMEGEGGFFWETDEEASEDFYAREDAVVDAFAHLGSDFGLTPDRLEEKHGVEHPVYTREDWRHDVGQGDTKLGYWEWVLHNVESHYYDPCDGCGKRGCDKVFVPDLGYVCRQYADANE